MPSFPHRRFLATVLLCLAWLLAFTPAHAADGSTIRIHFHRENNDYAGWGLHVWGAGLVLPHSVSWDRPLEPAGVDAFGIYFDVGVEPHVKDFNFILHRGDYKSTLRDMAVDLTRHGSEIWMLDDSDTIFTTPPEIGHAFTLGVQAEQRRHQVWWWVGGAGAVGLVVLAFVWRVARRRVAGAREELAANMKLLLQTQEELRAQGERMKAGSADELTGLPTRGALHQGLAQAIARASRDGGQVAVVFVDLDGFKQVNDTAGHDAGDEVLRTVARRLRAALRGSDVVARVGGDEFVAVIESFDSAAQVFKVGRKLVRAAAEPIPVGEQSHQIGASVGIALFPGDGADAASLLKAADDAMYDIKRGGKNGCRFVDAARQTQLERQLALEEGLRASLDQDRLSLTAQPLVELPGGRRWGDQASAVWVHDGLPQNAQAVVGACDDPALATALDRWLLSSACRHAARQVEGGCVAVELSGATSEMAAQVRETLAEHGLPPQRLLLWFPARLLADGQVGAETLLRLRSHGVRVGYTGVSEADVSLQRFVAAPIDMLRIEASVRRNEALGTGYVRALAALGAQCGFSVAVTGLASDDDRRWAEGCGCSFGTGPACVPAAVAPRPQPAAVSPR
ncbi:diguanylate cyclase domain-containing protein [Piscinibacter terrae]|uniref:diguanylate cyclase domain-containing protein n=1 Tax=Piscinibacter terrae TaxID=2496871 RepID=UPI001386891C|nr:diguanylate cyclase [Albitalea terrae]